MPKIIENLQQRLVQEASRQIEQLGYENMTIRSVAKECGVGVGTVYNYYPSKEALVAAYLLEDWKVCVAVFTAASDNARDREQVLWAIYENLNQFMQRHTQIFRAETAAASFSGSFSPYHSMLRSQLAAPIRKFCRDDFTAEFVAEALLTWTVAGKDFDEVSRVLKRLF